MDKYNVKIGIEAQDDILAIFDYIFTELENPRAADRVLNALIKKCLSLEIFPEASPVSFELLGNEFRFAHYKKYVIVYYIDKKTHSVKIRNIIYSRRNIKTIYKA